MDISVVSLQNGYVPEVATGPLVWAVIVLYFAVILGIGALFYNRSRETLSDFWIAGREIPTYVQIFAFLAVLGSAGTFLGLGGGAYDTGAAF
jgi:Na+/proline symporter